MARSEISLGDLHANVPRLLGSRQDSPSPLRQPFQEIELLTMAERDEDVTRFHARVRWWIENHRSGAFLDGDDDDAQLLSKLAGLQRAADELARRSDQRLLDLQLHVLRARG